MYVPIKTEAIVTQDIGPTLTAEYKESEALFHAFIRAKAEAEIAISQLPGYTGVKLHNLIQRDTPDDGDEDYTPKHRGKQKFPIREVLEMLGPEARRKLVYAKRLHDQLGGVGRLLWFHIEEQFFPDDEWHLGVREHLDEAGVPRVALVKVLPEDAKPQDVEGFIKNLMGEGDASKEGGKGNTGN